jgi:U3 small nucleolar RNA-associated protein 14
MQKVQAKTDAERARAKEDAVVEIDMTQAMALPESESGKKSNEAKKKDANKKEKGDAKGVMEVDAAYADSEDEGSDVDERGVTAFKQRELVAMAFAGDNVVEVCLVWLVYVGVC